MSDQYELVNGVVWVIGEPEEEGAIPIDGVSQQVIADACRVKHQVEPEYGWDVIADTIEALTE